MEFSFNLENLQKPKSRLLLGVLLLAIGVTCILGNTWNLGVTESDCITVEATFEDCKYYSMKEANDSNSIYLSFEDYPSTLDIHPSCANDRLTQKLMELKSGTEMQLLVNEEARCIYELKVAGETWLSYDEATEKIGNNMILVKNIGYVALAAGIICLFTVIVPLIWKLLHKTPKMK
ncbi:MAG: hypothetical protein IJ282_01125 [Lachnospiraceae bacterium]|nr:hypothetical protein [Lachnospiraceae bacterium]